MRAGSGRRILGAEFKNSMEVAMFANALKAGPVILPVSIVTGVLFLLIDRKAGVQNAFWWIVGSVICGVIFVAIYAWTGTRWPGMEANIFFKLGMITFAGFTVLALIACPLMKSTGRIPVYTLMNLIWAAGYGWFLPQLLK